jgi:hypothetical protein
MDWALEIEKEGVSGEERKRYMQHILSLAYSLLGKSALLLSPDRKMRRHVIVDHGSLPRKVL